MNIEAKPISQQLTEKHLSTETTLPVTYIIHHGDHDGFIGAAIAQTINRAGHKSIKTFATNYRKDFPFDKEVLTKADHLYIIDFSYDRKTLDDLNDRVEKLLVLDHHAGMEKELEGLPYVIFDKSRSGAKLSWDHFTDGYYGDNSVVNIVDAYDLWNKDYLDNTCKIVLDNGDFKTSLTWKDVVAYHLGTLEQQKNIEFWIGAVRAFNIDVGLLNTGHEMYAKVLELAENVGVSAKSKKFTVQKKWEGIIFEGSVGSVSLVSDALLYPPDVDGEPSSKKRRDLTCCYFRPSDDQNKMVVSLRSASESKEVVNALQIAKTLGGGGHVLAAGCTFEYSGDPDLFPGFFISKLREMFSGDVEEVL